MSDPSTHMLIEFSQINEKNSKFKRPQPSELLHPIYLFFCHTIVTNNLEAIDTSKQETIPIKLFLEEFSYNAFYSCDFLLHGRWEKPMN